MKAAEELGIQVYVKPEDMYACSIFGSYKQVR